MIVHTQPVGLLQCNCTILGCPKTRQAIVVDPGGDVEDLLAVLARHELKVAAIVHTHAHFDHCAGTEALRVKTGASAWLHPGDQFLVDHFARQGELVGIPLDLGPGPTIDDPLEDGQTIPFGAAASLVIHTPGHTPGSVCFSVQTPDGMLLLSGDTLFQMGVGRTDFPGGSWEQLQASIRERLFTLEDATRVIPGHGPETTIGAERRDNPFLR